LSRNVIQDLAAPVPDLDAPELRGSARPQAIGNQLARNEDRFSLGLMPGVEFLIQVDEVS
jgi:hypothetical protein